MLSLIMDTSNQYLMVSLYEDDQCIETIQELGSQRQSENAIPYLASLLEKHQKELLDIDEMIITCGPGSYTGERVAMTIAKTLSVISPVKIKVISSLAAYAGKQKCVSVIDARSQKIFVCAYECGKPLIHEQLLPISDFMEFMKDYEGFDVVGQTQVVNYPMKEVDLAHHLYILAKDEEAIDNVDALVPRYLKDVEAKKICL
ncbi:MAG: tRNA (adenosine(37)-N6)-threonylcarbamoyltransferase complex dimerization subunit type 1 TsaB [Longibaculum muris]|uniref:tRNA threonylcarbamoyl adenosine modification protein YeaZ n=1 Tax=Longibaculum muris TaxID=1796628 RepID=A0A4R3ZB42_9FIRM|nr:tRNA (adenosine(37)-N6)-threonylcarbamoyltransferase complex dimerization subunit type 1 TsaB [Longibaculum muris]KXU48993.1 universal bacterial protein YeaZ [Candidatus Stoquefichus sp. KLE1796]MBS5369235.1 tRNA (adenosine(37)-N6)-threonylcarbamoyltransferase complex dimerization subunit type 1 TsaB [Coprobacillus cateniformis]MCR1886788.1 tRNA (adenosine(37)-N6)-threonylcarbamoyltransferase complex dimerization subunit type 1 TsaB [Longibaculum muris]MED9810552.1 tRNA (adenosine(37)-N6)-th